MGYYQKARKLGLVGFLLSYRFLSPSENGLFHSSQEGLKKPRHLTVSEVSGHPVEVTASTGWLRMRSSLDYEP
jgi:hypothetical protein